MKLWLVKPREGSDPFEPFTVEAKTALEAWLEAIRKEPEYTIYDMQISEVEER